MTKVQEKNGENLEQVYRKCGTRILRHICEELKLHFYRIRHKS